MVPIVCLLVSMSLFSLSSTLSDSMVKDDGSLDGNTRKEGKVLRFPLFPFLIIHINPLPCNSTQGMNGTCYSKEDCNKNGGQEDGSCANGLGVCCLLERRCGSVVKENNSLLVNNEYPEHTEHIGNCQYVIERASDDICQLRLDFELFQLVGPDNESSLCEEDSFTVFGTAGENSGVICGENRGQHMYLDLSSASGSARINIATTSMMKKRIWKIRTTQISCQSSQRAPQNCLQYYTDYSGIIKSFNYQETNGSHLIGGLSYAICIRTREGFCGITYQSDDFSLSGDRRSKPANVLSGDTSCKEDFLSIFVQDKIGRVGADRYCGTGFNDTTTYSKPFQIRVITDATEPRKDVANNGFVMKYMQIPC